MSIDLISALIEDFFLLVCLILILEGYLEGYQRTAPPRPEGELNTYRLQDCATKWAA